MVARLFHYYGDTVRQFFFVAGVIMLVALPFFRDEIPVPSIFGIFGALVIVLAAGFTSPTQRWAIVLDVFVSFIGFVIFEYHAVVRYSNGGDPLFWIDQILALLFFIALYFSTKTVRSQLGG